MKAKLLVVSLSLVIVAACSKGKFESRPTLTFVSINGNQFTDAQRVSIKLRLTDKEGDFYADSINNKFLAQKLFVKKISFVCVPVAPDTVLVDRYDIPAFTSTKYLDVELDVNFSYNTGSDIYPVISRCKDVTDSLYFKFWIKDAAGHVSDTVSTPTFKLIK